jgi:hypothetical protein
MHTPRTIGLPAWCVSAVDRRHLGRFVAFACGRGEVVQSFELLCAQLDVIGGGVSLDAGDPLGAGDRSDVVALREEPGQGAERAPTTIFNLDGRDPAWVASGLADRRIAVWSGDNYACDLIDALGLRARGGAVRAGIGGTRPLKTLTPPLKRYACWSERPARRPLASP